MRSEDFIMPMGTYSGWTLGEIHEESGNKES